MLHCEVSLALLALGWFGLLEVGVLAEMLLAQLLGQGQISSLWHNALFVEHGDDAKRLE